MSEAEVAEEVERIRVIKVIRPNMQPRASRAAARPRKPSARALPVSEVEHE
jgi:hypothetical protein